MPENKPLDGGKEFRELLGKLVRVPKKEANRRAATERKRREKKKKEK